MKRNNELYFRCENDTSDVEPVRIDEGRTTGSPSPKRK